LGPAFSFDPGRCGDDNAAGQDTKGEFLVHVRSELTRICVLAAALAGSSGGSALAADAAGRPNVVVILADDIGYGDFGCYGATQVKTPNVDRLAAQGLRFTDAHSPAAVCTPTRYALLTGQYAFRHKPGASILSGVAPLSIPLDRYTLPKLFKDSGYVTGAVGEVLKLLGDM
jgi:hypothetical protein